VAALVSSSRVVSSSAAPGRSRTGHWCT